MIISVTCRHGTQRHVNRKEIGRELVELYRLVPVISRTQVVFCKETHRKPSADQVTCHLSVEIPRRKPIDIYQQHETESQAFYRARERVIQTMTRQGLSKPHLYQARLNRQPWEYVL